MRPTVLTETRPFAWGGYVAFEGRFRCIYSESLCGGAGAGAKDGSMNLPTSMAVTMFEPVDLTLNLILDGATMATSCEHSFSPLLKVMRFWSQLTPSVLRAQSSSFMFTQLRKWAAVSL